MRKRCGSEEMRMEVRRKYVVNEGKKSASESNKVKLTELVISKFEGTTFDGSAFGTNSRQK